MLIGDTILPGRPTFVQVTTPEDEAMQAGLSAVAQAADLQRKRDAYAALRDANDQAQRFVYATGAAQAARVEAFDRRNALIHDLTGVQLNNPLHAFTGPDPFVPDLPGAPPRPAEDPAARIEDWKGQVRALAAQHPELAPQLLSSTSMADEALAVTQGADRQLSQAAGHAVAAGLPHWQMIAAGLQGGGIGMLADPVQVSAMFLGAGEASGATVAGRIFQTALTEAAINAGIQGTVEAASYSWRREAGLDVGWKPSLTQVGLAALFGGALGGAGRGAAEVMRALGRPELADAAARVAAGQGTPGEAERLAAEIGQPLPNLDARVARISEEAAARDAASFGRAPQGMTPEAANSTITEAARAFDNPDLAPAPAERLLPERGPVETQVLSDAGAAPPAGGERLTLAGRPIEYRSFAPDQLGADVALYQYKGNADAAGVTGRLGDVQRWEPTASGKVFVHERDGQLWIADGHQRLDLAQRTRAAALAAGDEAAARQVRLDGYLFREKDGWTPADVRALAAKKNMQEGSGTAMDAARILRDRPDLLDASLPMTGAMMKKAEALSRLSDEAWGLVVNGIAEEQHGVAVGRLVSDPAQQSAVLAELARAAPQTERESELYVREALAAGFGVEHQADMFGSAAVTRSLMPERVKVLDSALSLLKRDKKLFSALAHNADLIEAAGNVLDTAGNVDVARTAETVAALIDRLARSRSVVSDLLTESAERLAQGSTPGREARAFVDAVRAELDRNGIRGLLAETPRPQLKPARAAEPASAEAVNVAETALREEGGGAASEAGVHGGRSGEPALAEGVPPPERQIASPPPKSESVWDKLPDGVDAEGQPRFTDFARESEKAGLLDDAADLVAACKE